MWEAAEEKGAGKLRLAARGPAPTDRSGALLVGTPAETLGFGDAGLENPLDNFWNRLPLPERKIAKPLDELGREPDVQGAFVVGSHGK